MLISKAVQLSFLRLEGLGKRSRLGWGSAVLVAGMSVSMGKGDKDEMKLIIVRVGKE